MSSRLAVDVQGNDKVAYVKLSGQIDEDNDLAEITKRVNQPVAVLDTSDIDRINSCGVRDWVAWLNDMDKQGVEIFLAQCSPAIMTQVNLVNNFVGKGTIVSFYAPYFCPSCETEKMLLIKTKDALKQTPFAAPSCRCDQCDHTMDFDDIESSYFAFISTVEDKEMSPEVQELVDQNTSGADGALRTRTTSMPLVNTATQTGTTPATLAGAPKDLRSLLTENVTFSGSEQQQPSGGNAKLVLYLVVGLLVVAIGLLGFVVMRAM